MIIITILNITYTCFELSSNHDSAPDNKESQGLFTDNFKYFCMKMYCQDSSNQGSQNMFFYGGENNRIILRTSPYLDLNIMI